MCQKVTHFGAKVKSLQLDWLPASWNKAVSLHYRLRFGILFTVCGQQFTNSIRNCQNWRLAWTYGPTNHYISGHPLGKDWFALPLEICQNSQIWKKESSKMVRNFHFHHQCYTHFSFYSYFLCACWGPLCLRKKMWFESVIVKGDSVEYSLLMEWSAEWYQVLWA